MLFSTNHLLVTLSTTKKSRAERGCIERGIFYDEAKNCKSVLLGNDSPPIVGNYATGAGDGL